MSNPLLILSAGQAESDRFPALHPLCLIPLLLLPGLPAPTLPLQQPRGHRAARGSLFKGQFCLSCLHASDGFCPMQDNQRPACGLESSTPRRAPHLASLLTSGLLTPPSLFQPHRPPGASLPNELSPHHLKVFALAFLSERLFSPDICMAPSIPSAQSVPSLERLALTMSIWSSLTPDPALLVLITA